MKTPSASDWMMIAQKNVKNMYKRGHTFGLLAVFIRSYWHFFNVWIKKTSILKHNTLISYFVYFNITKPKFPARYSNRYFLNNYVSVPCNNYMYMLRDLPEPFSNLHYTMGNSRKYLYTTLTTGGFHILTPHAFRNSKMHYPPPMPSEFQNH